MATKYLDTTGLTHLWAKIKSYISTLISGLDKKPFVIDVAMGDTTVPSGTYDAAIAALRNNQRVIMRVAFGQNYFLYYTLTADTTDVGGILYFYRNEGGNSQEIMLLFDDNITIGSMYNVNKSYGNIQTDGTVNSYAAIENNDQLLFADYSANSQVKKTQITFDGSTDTQALSKKGTWETFVKPSSPAFSGTPTAPTAASGTNTTQIATTAFVQDAISLSKAPLATKSYTDGIIASNNAFANYVFYYASVRPTSWDAQWRFKVKIHCWIPNESMSDAVCIWEQTGVKSTRTAFYCRNSHLSTDYRAFYANYTYILKEAGYTAGYGHLIGISLGSAYLYTNTGYKRSFTVDVLEVENCTLTLFNEPLKRADVAEYSTTNYDTYYASDAYNNGLHETGDNDTLNADSLHGFRPTAGSMGFFAHSPILMTGNGTWENIVTSYTTDTNKVRNTNGFVLGQVWESMKNVNPNTASTANDFCRTLSPNIDIRYLINGTTASVTLNAPIYLVGEVHSDGLFYLDSTWWTQTLPSTEDGKIYWQIGYVTYNGNWTFVANLPIYHYKDGAIREYCYSSSSGGGDTNVIETVKVNGSALTPDANKAVDVKTHDAVESHGTSDTTFALTPNVFHTWGEVTALTLTLATPSDATIVNEYMFEFQSGSTATTLSLPATVEWDADKGDINIESGYIYQVSILNNLALWGRKEVTS